MKKMVRFMIERLGLRPDGPVFMKHEVPKKFEFGKPFLTSVVLFK
jgi:hypothetical protein